MAQALTSLHEVLALPSRSVKNRKQCPPTQNLPNCQNPSKAKDPTASSVVTVPAEVSSGLCAWDEKLAKHGTLERV